jgi:murein DD-endopeptidase MepM/ murein hydrolase activator NlpD
MKKVTPITLALLLILPQLGLADIYRYVDEEGVVCFTDAPRKNGATLVMKERSAPRRSGKRSMPGHLASTGIGEKPSLASMPTLSPTLPVQGRISSLVGVRHDPINGTLREHHGIDIAVAEGTAVRPVAPGRVIFAGLRGGYGNMVIVDHGDGTITLYAHNSVNLVAEGDEVDGTSPIALSGSTGRSTGPHLHFEAWRGDTNITSTFLAGGPAMGSSGSRRTADAIRRIVQADGTLYFSNIP